MTDLSDILPAVKREVEGLGAKVSEDFRVAMRFASRFADVMLNLTVTQEEGSCVFRLDRRREQYVVELSKVLVEETYLVGLAPINRVPTYSEYVVWKDSFVEAVAIIGCVDSLFQKIAEYESGTVDYVSKGRRYQRSTGVSITGFDALRDFDIDDLKKFPSIYTTSKQPRPVLLCKARALGDESALKVLAEYSG